MKHLHLTSSLKLALLLGVLLAALVLSACGSEEKGVLQGEVKIGPLSPVERPGTPVPTPCEVYEARKIMVYNRSGSKLIEHVDINCQGIYRVELSPGTYMVDINKIGIDHSSDVPRTITIEPGGTVTLDISIDTGIR